jgi:hypothetical protein
MLGNQGFTNQLDFNRINRGNWYGKRLYVKRFTV